MTANTSNQRSLPLLGRTLMIVSLAVTAALGTHLVLASCPATQPDWENGNILCMDCPTAQPTEGKEGNPCEKAREVNYQMVFCNCGLTDRQCVGNGSIVNVRVKYYSGYCRDGVCQVSGDPTGDTVGQKRLAVELNCP